MRNQTVIKCRLVSLFLAVLLVLVSGCASVITQDRRFPEVLCEFKPPKTIPRVYSGTIFDVSVVVEHPGGQAAAFLFWDIPLSLVADTAMLPYTITMQSLKGSHTCPSLEQRRTTAARRAKNEAADARRAARKVPREWCDDGQSPRGVAYNSGLEDTACAQADLYMFSESSRNCDRAIEIILPNAEAGHLWAELRLASAYHLGCGVERDINKAVEWYRKAASKSPEAGALRRNRNRRSEALMAEYRLSQIYLDGQDIPKDVVEAYLHARDVHYKSQARPVLFCCEWAPGGGLGITPEMIFDNLRKIERAMTAQDKENADERYQNWKP